MYITYDKLQYCLEEDIGGSCSGPSRSPTTLFTPQCPRSGPVEVPEFKPTWLIRTKDMKTVRGSDVQEPYYALSYSWNQSGDIFKDDDDGQKYTRIDNGKHEIIISQERKIKVPREKVIDIIPAKRRLVMFEGLIQEICQDFGIQYLWYDQKCIDQDNPDEKRREIKQMHKIYSNAQCTVALIPEFRITKGNSSNLANVEAIATSEWSKRIWTLEEAIMSKRLLFIGRDVHLWSYVHDRNHGDKVTYSHTIGHAFIYDLCTKPANMSVSTVLWHARRRTSSKLHDRVFALANLLPGVTADLAFDYNQPLLDAMLHFFGLIAPHDLSILCFGIPFLENHEDIHLQLQEDALLPTWTGSSYSHATRLLPDRHNFDASAINCKVDGPLLQLTCNCIHVSIEQRSYELSKFSGGYDETTGTTQLPHTSPHDRTSLVFITESSKPYTGLPACSVGLKRTHFLPFAQDKTTNAWVNTTSNPDNILSAVLSLTDASCKKCIILSELAFRYHPTSGAGSITVIPVVKCDGNGYYYCVGTCIIDDDYFDLKRFEYAYPNLVKKQRFTIK
ncbi:hypothetical protein BJV82DRAFT_717783 [Fennellomyces sp. T-0311]|nr:hypothetical protein BJV82DRAFT_717783 [Fennellomyces sp. T-0311]